MRTARTARRIQIGARDRDLITMILFMSTGSLRKDHAGKRPNAGAKNHRRRSERNRPLVGRSCSQY
jgi:hypothetical protein